VTFAAYLRSHWSAVRAQLLELTARLSDANLDFRPYDGAWPLRELLLHVAHEEWGEVQHGVTRSLPDWPAPFPDEDAASLDAIRARLDQVHAETERYLEGLDDAQLLEVVETPWGSRDTRLALLGHVVEHEIHHRAEVSLILGLLGRQGLDA
jgi:uncharacterized damage-inducible protein DinB